MHATNYKLPELMVVRCAKEIKTMVCSRAWACPWWLWALPWLRTLPI